MRCIPDIALSQNMVSVPLSGRVALVVGASGRLGGVLAWALARAGADVLLHANANHPKARRLAKTIERTGRRARVLRQDLTRPGAGAALFEKARAAVDRKMSRSGAGAFDLVLFAAADYPEGGLDSFDAIRLRRLNALSLEAPLELTSAFAGHCREANMMGSFIHFLDARLADATPGREAYLLGKRIQAALMEISARAHAPFLRVNAVAPGAVRFPPNLDPGIDDTHIAATAAASAATGDGDEADAPSAVALAAAPLARLPDAAEVARATLWLATSPSVTGQIIYVDGGRHLRRG